MYGHPMAEGIEGNDSVNTTETDKGNLSYNMKVSSFSLFALNLGRGSGQQDLNYVLESPLARSFKATVTAK